VMCKYLTTQPRIKVVNFSKKKKISCTNIISFCYRHAEEPIRSKGRSCSHCSKTFATNQNLREHMRTHRGEKRFSCPHCSKSFARGDYLRDHLVVHTGEKPFACAQCGERFPRLRGLKIHQRIPIHVLCAASRLPVVAACGNI
jgi:uncharacterized Zn-finger protein